MSSVPTVDPRAAAVVAFWRSAGRDRWFAKDAAFDRAFRERFLALHTAAASRVLDGWAADADHALALVILLDQFPRNAFRGTPRMYASDPQALRLANQMVQTGIDRAVDAALRVFCYLPFEHAENPADQATSVRLQTPLGEPWLAHAIEHRDIIQRFGRFPHRNLILGRAMTPAEQAFLDAGGFAG
jgi:uncharacterized protein (DUF924 family)